MEQIIKGICLANNATYTFNYLKGYPPVVNHPDETELVLEASKEIKEVTSALEIEPQMGGEDFAYYLQDKPGAFFFMGEHWEGIYFQLIIQMFDLTEKPMQTPKNLL